MSRKQQAWPALVRACAGVRRCVLLALAAPCAAAGAVQRSAAAPHLFGDTQVGKATPFSICLPLNDLAHSLHARAQAPQYATMREREAGVLVCD